MNEGDWLDVYKVYVSGLLQRWIPLYKVLVPDDFLCFIYIKIEIKTKQKE